MRKKLFKITLSFIIALTCSLSLGHATIKIGVNAHRGADYVKERWTDLARHLSQELGQPVKILPLRVASLLSDVKRKQVDFVFSNPVQAVVLNAYLRTIPMVTLRTNAGSQFAGVIVAKKDSGITQSKDLIGKKVVSMRFKVAAGGYIFQTYHLLQKGIDPHKDFASIKQLRSQDKLVRAVDRGLADAAFVRSGLLEKMAKSGKIKMDDFVVVDRRDPNNQVPFVHTTQAYPEWYISAMPQTDEAIVKRLTSALLSLPANSQAAQVAKIKGFVKPIPLDNLKAALQTLRVPPYTRTAR
ncbi:phosphate/phosphite/phosphonate ABC transporter substrate-binding protein [Candidatus Entotheonella palauensis]|uniref:phosphate/phosphite/phosphonate ABC transporter substrate-binding protein n=1 Tax=Candidatus Entotheonella palauensis TaxID=93172 RepID=UPI000B7F98D1|nr:phosphate/phosphite/phosphonate ABC transporter substrate-binding protein [Candidatus Entotheonella palauensis]